MITPNQLRRSRCRTTTRKTRPHSTDARHRRPRRPHRRSRLPPLGCSTVSEHAEIHVIDAATLAVVMMCAHNVSIVEHAIHAENYDLADISTDRDIITITIRDRACSS